VTINTDEIKPLSKKTEKVIKSGEYQN